jgi:hypothetical protein
MNDYDRIHEVAKKLGAPDNSTLEEDVALLQTPAST